MALDLITCQNFLGIAVNALGGIVKAPSLVVDGVEYTGPGVSAVVGPFVITGDTKGGGKVRYQAINVWIPKSLMASPPSTTAVIVYGGVTYQDIETDDDNQLGQVWHLRAVRFKK